VTITLPKAVDYLDRAKKLKNLGQYTAARNECEQALQLTPDSCEVRNYLGYLFLLEGEYQKAETELLKVLELDPRNLAALENLGELYVFQKDYSTATDFYERISDIQEMDLEQRMVLVDLCINTKQYSRAIYHLNVIRKFHPSSSRIYLQYLAMPIRMIWQRGQWLRLLIGLIIGISVMLIPVLPPWSGIMSATIATGYIGLMIPHYLLEGQFGSYVIISALIGVCLLIWVIVYVAYLNQIPSGIVAPIV